MPENQPNVLLFCVDEMRAEHMGCMGHDIVQTPNLDGLAASGTLFRRAHCNNPICMPARATMFTGLMPRDHGLRINGQTMHPGLPLLPQIMHDAGYRTHSAGKLHLTPWVPRADPFDTEQFPEDMDAWNAHAIEQMPTPYCGFASIDLVGGHTSFAFGEYINWLADQGYSKDDLMPRNPGAATCRYQTIPEELHYNRWIADSAIRKVEEAADSPFFIWCSFPDPHMPVAAPKPYADMYSPADVQLPPSRQGEIDDLPPWYKDVINGEMKPNGVDNSNVTDDFRRQMIATTFAMVTHLDVEVGRVLQALDDVGKRQDTIIVFISDHGDMMGDHGLIWKSFYTFSGCRRIPLIVSAPGQTAGQVSDALVAQIDLMPTLLDLCGLPMPGDGWQARPTPFDRGIVRPLQLYPGKSWREHLFADAPIAVHDEVVIENDDPCTGLQVRCLVTDHYRLTIYPGTPDGELFDLQKDPDELHNLWYNERHQTLRHQLTARLLDAYARTEPIAPIPRLELINELPH